jgi:hypothetical protein
MRNKRLIEIYYSIGILLVLSNAIRNIFDIELGKFELLFKVTTAIGGLIFLTVALVLHYKNKNKRSE